MTITVRPVRAHTPDGPAGYVLLIVDTPTGRAVYFLEPDNADMIAQLLTQAAGPARSGLIVANGSGY